MYIEGFGKKDVKFYSVEGTFELLEVEFSHKRKKHYGIVDENGRLLVPISDIPFLEVFATKDRCNYCFTRQDQENGRYESFHLQKQENGKFYLKADIKGNEVTNCRLVGTVKDDYWFIESTTNGITEISLYDVRNVKILTPGFTDISFEEEQSRVLAFVEKEIYTLINGESVYLTSLLSFIDYEGNFVAPIYDTDKDVDAYYDARSYNFDKSFKSFNCFLNSVAEKHKTNYIEHREHVTDVFIDMFSNLYSVEEIKKVNKPAKILEYRKDKK